MIGEMSSLILVALLLGMLAAYGVAWGCLLRFGLHWAKVPGASVSRLMGMTVLALLVQTLFGVVYVLVTRLNALVALPGMGITLIAIVLVESAMIAQVFQTTFPNAIRAWLPTLLAQFASSLFILCVFRPFLFEGFKSPSNAMAPTLLGEHVRATCLECGQPTYCSAERDAIRMDENGPMICGNFHITRPARTDEHIHPGDRFLVAKFLTPRRFDIVVFRYPENPAELYLFRLVGLPGETITIRDGKAFANGEELLLPEDLSGLTYATQGDWGGDVWGSDTRPAKLEADEYFVLGDFSLRAKDSRLWRDVEPGHNPFAVPSANLYGVVTHTYWPRNRWRIHR